MNKGVVLFAHNTRQIDYAKIALVSGSLAKKHLDVPVSLLVDQSTIDWMKESNDFKKATSIFDKIICTERPPTLQSRKFRDGNNHVVSPFNNSNRNNVWQLTPYDRTLLIDSDFFIFSDNLNNYWNVDSDLLISTQYADIADDKRIGYHDRYISDTGVRLLWATTVMFTKNKNTQIFFNLVEHIRQNYKQFADIYRFDHRMFRNDIAFAIARHIMYGFEQDNDYSLPPVLSIPDIDRIFSVDKNSIKVLSRVNSNDVVSSIKNKDIHIMNKMSITRNLNKFMELV